MSQKGNITEVKRLTSGWASTPSELDKQLQKEINCFVRRMKGKFKRFVFR